MLGMGKNINVVTAGEINRCAISKFKYRPTFEHHHPFILSLIIPAMLRGFMALGDYAFNANAWCCHQGFKYLCTRITGD